MAEVCQILTRKVHAHRVDSLGPIPCRLFCFGNSFTVEKQQKSDRYPALSLADTESPVLWGIDIILIT